MLHIFSADLITLVAGCRPCRSCRLAALHVAATTGRADIVRQLVAAGASASKALPMDYRTLLKQHPDMLELPQHAKHAQHAQHAQAAAGVGLEAEAFATMAASGWGQREQTGQGEGRAPAPKRGRYVTVGPAAIGAPSLQYCTALHLAALNGQLEVVHTLRATGQVSLLCMLNAYLMMPAACKVSMQCWLLRAQGPADHLCYTEDLPPLLPAPSACPQCDVNAKNIEGATALHLAAYAGHTQVSPPAPVHAQPAEACSPARQTGSQPSCQPTFESLPTKLAFPARAWTAELLAW